MVNLAKFVVIVAHPDDEILWFAGAVRRAARTIICYGDNPLSPKLGERRRKLVGEYPIEGIKFLDIAEPRGLSDHRPGGPQSSIESAQHVAGNPARQPFAGAGVLPSNIAAEEVRRKLLLDGLGSLTAWEGIEGLLTHNPWGEYGHEDHVRVNAVATMLAHSLRIPLYVSNFVSLRVLIGAKAVLDAGVSDFIEVPLDMEFIQSVLAHYKGHSCWTWRRNWEWPIHDVYLRLGGEPISQAAYALRIIQPLISSPEKVRQRELGATPLRTHR